MSRTTQKDNDIIKKTLSQFENWLKRNGKNDNTAGNYKSWLNTKPKQDELKKIIEGYRNHDNTIENNDFDQKITKSCNDDKEKRNLKSALKSFKKFLKEQSDFFDAYDAEIDTIKQTLSQIAIFYPAKKFSDYVNKKGGEYGYLIFEKDNNSVRMRRKRGNEKRGDRERINDETILITDNANGRFNTEFGNAFEDAYGRNIPKSKYTICHIGGNTAHNPDYFAAIPNVVYVPSYFAGVTDHLPEIRQFLAGISYQLYGKILSDECKAQLDDFYGPNALLSPGRGQLKSNAHSDPKKLLSKGDVKIWNEGRKKFLEIHPFSKDYEATAWEKGEGKLS